MNRVEQYKINSEAYHIWEEAMDQWLHEDGGYLSVKKLRTCKAIVYETTEYYILQSYNTPVAVIVKASKTLIDMLRRTYGYTATSAQHIAKFKHDYTSYPYNHPVLTWRELN